MADDDLRYDRMVEDAKRSVVCKALTHVAERGLPGEHHLYITFRTDHPDVVMPDQLRARYPSEMTIVLQHQFWGLEVGPDAFGVTLSFSNVPERLTVPFESVAAFADPSVRFVLQFETGAGAQRSRDEDLIALGEAVSSEAEAANLKPLKERLDSSSDSGAAGDRPGDDPDKVVPLDAFRKVDRAREK
jgi:hypothetical protein